MVQVKWTKLATNDLKEIHDYIARDSSRYAKIQVIRIKARALVLKRFPLSGKIIPEFHEAQYRELIEGHYRIIYKIVNPIKIDILTIHHTSRDLTNRRIE